MTLSSGEACVEKVDSKLTDDGKMVGRQLEKNDWKLAATGWASQGFCIIYEMDLGCLNGAGLIDGAISN